MCGSLCVKGVPFYWSHAVSSEVMVWGCIPSSYEVGVERVIMCNSMYGLVVCHVCLSCAYMCA